jgi:hypothetical protein
VSNASGCDLATRFGRRLRRPPDVPGRFVRGAPPGLIATTNHGDTRGTGTAYAVWRPRRPVAARAQGPDELGGSIFRGMSDKTPYRMFWWPW